MGNKQSLRKAKLGKDFSFTGSHKCRVVDVYDGDSLRLAFDWKGEIIQWQARMKHYDAPEMKPRKDLPDREAHVAAAKKARQMLIDIIDGDLVQADMYGFDKYGRILVELHTDSPFRNSVYVNNVMMHSGLVKPYEGGTKDDWS